MSEKTLVERLRAQAAGWDDYPARLDREAADALDTALSRQRELEAALKPFAAYAENDINVHMVDVPDDQPFIERHGRESRAITYGDLRRARSTLSAGDAGKGTG